MFQILEPMMIEPLGRTAYDEDHELFRDQVRKFCERHLTPNLDRWEHEGIVDRDFWRTAGEAGLLCPTAPEQYGGLGLDFRYNAIIAEEADSPSSKQYVTTSLPIYQQFCPGCKITVKTITATTNSLLASATSSNILAAPSANYYYTEFEDSLQPTIQGIQQSGRSSMSLSVAGGSVNGLGLLKGNSVVKAVVAVDQAYAGWALTDEILRMMTKSGPVNETFPSRLFTKQNIGSIQVTPAAQASGQWFGNTSFQSAFAKLWGAG